jgi:hypothetical protein
VKVRPIALWSGLALPPMCWFVSLEANFSLAPLACSGHSKALLYLVAGVALVLSLAGGGVSWFHHTLLREANEFPLEIRKRNQALAIAGSGLGFLFALVILAQSIPTLLFSGCE